MIKAESGKLRAFLDATHEHADIRDARTKRIGGVVTDARKQGFDGKALRKVFVRERMQPEKLQREDETLSIYEAALGAKGAALRAIETGELVGAAAKAHGVHRSTLARARHVAKQGPIATSHDQASGETTDEAPPRPKIGAGPSSEAAR